MAPGILSVFYLFFGISSGVAVNYVLSRLDCEPSFTLVMFLIGVVTAIIAGRVGGTQSREPLFEAVLQWGHLDPDVILYALLPILLFGEAQTLSLHHVKKVFYSAALLAIPGAAFTAYMLALLMRHVLGVTWDWNLCWLFGSVLCATDPVSVVAMLKSVASSSNAQRRLQYLIIGEALLNDGIALVLFEIVGSRHANELSGDQVIGYFGTYFVKVLLVSPLLGLVVGLAATTCMTYLDRRLLSSDDLMQVAVTVCAAYLSFFLSQYVCKLSGVLACCAAGLVVSYMGRPLVLNPAALELVWHCLEWSANTLIFLVSGLIVGSQSVFLFDAENLLAIFVVYTALFVIRAAMLAVCHFPLQYHISEYSVKAGCFNAFAGLRGAISLTLAVLLMRHSRRPGVRAGVDGDDNTSDLILFDYGDVERAAFVIAWVVALTILVNGLLAPLVLRWLGIAGASSSAMGDSVLLSYVSLRLRVSASKEYRQLKREFPEHSVEYLTRCGDVLRGAVKSAGSAEIELLAVRGSASPEADVGACSGQAGRRNEDEMAQIFSPLHESFASSRESEGDGKRGSDRHAEDHEDLTQSSVLRNEDEMAQIYSPLHRLFARSRDAEGDGKRGGDADVDEQEDEVLSQSGGQGGLGGVLRTVPLSSSLDPETPMLQRGYNMPYAPVPTSALQLTTGRSLSWIGLNELRSQDSSGGDFSALSLEPPDVAAIDPVLLEQFRQVFLKVVHLSYLKQISDGKLPRGSQAALVLLDSVEHGLETAHTPGLQDFEDLGSELGEWFSERALGLLLRCCCSSKRTGAPFSWAETLLGRLRQARQADQVHALLAFVEAHNYAQVKVPVYLGPDEFVNSAEEAQVVLESRENVAAALRALNEGYSPSALKEILSRKVASIILHSQEELILHFHDEGILGPLEAGFLHGALQKDIEILRRASESRPVMG